MLDDTKKLERAAEKESAGCLQLECDATLPADQEWYAENFKRAKRRTDEACDIQQMGADYQFRTELHMDLDGWGQGTTESSDPPGDTTAVRRGVTQRQTPRTEKPSDDERKARLRALNVDRHLYNMDASMRACTELQNECMSGGVTERAQEELSRRSTTRTLKRQKAGADVDIGRSAGVVKEANAAWTVKMEEFMQRRIEKVEHRSGETAEDFRERQARACLPEEKHWKHVCCVCDEAIHDIADECGECISPQAAAHADALVRTAFQVDVDETITSENNMELCLRVTRHTLQALERLRGTQRHECGAETATMAHLHPGVVWGTKQVGRRKCCDIENADLFYVRLPQG